MQALLMSIALAGLIVLGFSAAQANETLPTCACDAPPCKFLGTEDYLTKRINLK